MRFLIVLGVLLCLVQLVAGFVYCVKASYSNGNWTEKAEIELGFTCSYEVRRNNGQCHVSLEQKMSLKVGCISDADGNVQCNCKKDMCNIDGEELSKLNDVQKYFKAPMLPPVPEPPTTPLAPEGRVIHVPAPLSALTGKIPESPEKFLPPVPIKKITKPKTAKGKRESKTAELACNIEDIKKTMPKYDELPQPKLLRCSAGVFLLNSEWTDLKFLDVQSGRAACKIRFSVEELEGETFCYVGGEGIKKQENKKKKRTATCKLTRDGVHCSCDDSDDCNLDMNRFIAEAEEAAKRGENEKLKHCFEVWRSAPSQIVTTTAASTTTATTVTSATVAPTFGTGSASTDWMRVFVISTSAVILFSL